MGGHIDQNRIRFVTAFLAHLNNIRPRIMNRSSNIFEMYCYTYKLVEFMESGFTPIPEQLHGNEFHVHLNPGNPANVSYFRLRKVTGPDFNLYLNCKFEGASEVYHCPDIVLQNNADGKIHSIYECKNYANPLPLGIYREFIGYLSEMKIPKMNQKDRYDYSPEVRPSIYTSASAGDVRKQMLERYAFDVVENL